MRVLICVAFENKHGEKLIRSLSLFHSASLLGPPCSEGKMVTGEVQGTVERTSDAYMTGMHVLKTKERVHLVLY